MAILLVCLDGLPFPNAAETASGHKRGNLYVLDGTIDRKPDEALVAAQLTSNLWHQRLAHVNDKVLQKLVSCDVAGVDLKEVEPRSFCEEVENTEAGSSPSI